MKTRSQSVFGSGRTAAELAYILTVSFQAPSTRDASPVYAFFAGLATAIGARVSMPFSEGLSDVGDVTGRGSRFHLGAITGAGTCLGGIVTTLAVS